MIVDKANAIPAYKQLKEYILDGIAKEQWKEEIPSERQLCEKAGVTRMTVRQAIGELVSEGVLYRLKGKGTFVAKPHFEQHNVMSFSSIMAERGLTAYTKILHFEKDFPDMQSIDAAWAKRSSTFYRLRRLRCAGRDPVAIEEVFLPHSLCPSLETHDLTGSLYAILHTLGQVVYEQDVTITAASASDEEAAVFGIRTNTPLLYVVGSSLRKDGTPMFYERSCYLSNRFSYKVSILDRK